MLRKIHGLWIYTEQHSYTTITKGCVFLNSSSQHVFIYTAVFVTNVCHIQLRCSSLEYLTTGLTNGRGSNYRSSFSFLFSLPSLTGSPGEKKKKKQSSMTTQVIFRSSSLQTQNKKTRKPNSSLLYQLIQSIITESRLGWNCSVFLYRIEVLKLHTGEAKCEKHGIWT